MFNRDSWDGRGSLMRATVHYGQSYNNAFYQGGSIFFGDGDGVRFAPLGRAIDVVAHEWTHGVTESSAALVYTGESGALNEAMSDIFGAAVEASRMGVTSATWQVGENIFTPATFGDALRYMDTPTLDGASRDYYPELLASDDVHHSSGIGNLAFYLLANGGTHPRGRTSTAVIGIGINEAARVFYSALTAYLQSNDGYSQARNKTALASKVLYGVDSLQFRQVCAAWNAVGAPNDNSVCVTISPIRVRPVVSVLGKTVSWGAVAGATSYRVFSDSVALRTVTGTSTVVGVPLCEIVEVQVSACNVLGCGPLSNSVLVSGPKPPASCR
jgi:vibriolysin